MVQGVKKIHKYTLLFTINITIDLLVYLIYAAFFLKNIYSLFIFNIYRETAKCPKCSALFVMARNIQFVKTNVPDALIPHSYESAFAVI